MEHRKAIKFEYEVRKGTNNLFIFNKIVSIHDNQFIFDIDGE